MPKARAAPAEPAPKASSAGAPVQRTSIPSSWFLAPLHAKIKGAVRPSTALTRRKEIEVKVGLPRQEFETFMQPLQEADAKDLKRDPANGQLLPTRVTGTLRWFEYTIRKGSVSDRLFHMDSLDPPAPSASTTPAPETVAIGTEDVYEVEAIREKRTSGKRAQYLIKWSGWPEDANTWEKASCIHPALVAAFEGRPPPQQRALVPSLPSRGAGCARARLSAAEQRRGAVPETISMVCGNVVVKYSESIAEARMPVLKLIFKVLTMDKAGHITWPTTFDAHAQAALRMQARALLRKMIDDPLNPVDATMEPALTGVGTSSLFVPAKKRRLVEVEAEGE